MENSDEIDRARAAKRGSPFLNTPQAAAYLGISIRLLLKFRRNGGGPIFRRHCRFVQYHIDDLNAWSEANSGRAFRR